MAHKIEESKCVGCEACVATCPVEAIKFDGKICKIDGPTCVDCGACVSSCPTEAIVAE